MALCCLQPQLFLGFHDRTVANSEHFLFPTCMCVSTHLCACAKIKGTDMMGKGCCFRPMHLKAVRMINDLSCCTEKSADISMMEFSVSAPKLQHQSLGALPETYSSSTWTFLNVFLGHFCICFGFLNENHFTHQVSVYEWDRVYNFVNFYLAYFSLLIKSFGWFTITGGTENNISCGCGNSLPIFKTVIYFSHRNFAQHVNGADLWGWLHVWCAPNITQHSRSSVISANFWVCAMCVYVFIGSSISSSTHRSVKRTGELARCDSTSCMAFHSLIQNWLDETLLW